MCDVDEKNVMDRLNDVKIYVYMSMLRFGVSPGGCDTAGLHSEHVVGKAIKIASVRKQTTSNEKIFARHISLEVACLRAHMQSTLDQRHTPTAGNTNTLFRMYW